MNDDDLNDVSPDVEESAVQEKPLKSVEQKKSVSQRRRLVKAFVYSFLCSAFAMYAIVGIVKLNRTINRLTVSDGKAEQIVDDLRADLKIPLDVESGANEKTLPADYSTEAGDDTTNSSVSAVKR